MDKNVAEKEIDYQLIKLLLINLQREGLLTAKEAEEIRKKAQAELKPLIGIALQLIQVGFGGGCK